MKKTKKEVEEKVTIAEQIDRTWLRLLLQEVTTSEIQDTALSLATHWATCDDPTSIYSGGETHAHEYDLYMFADGSAIALPLEWHAERLPVVITHINKCSHKKLKPPKRQPKELSARAA